MSLKVKVGLSPAATALDLYSQIQLLEKKLIDASQAFSKPEILEDKLAQQLQLYRDAMNEAAASLAAGQQLAIKAEKLVVELPNKIDKLSRWSNDLSAAVGEAYARVNEVQGGVSNQIASSGVAAKSIQGIALASAGFITGDTSDGNVIASASSIAKAASPEPTFAQTTDQGAFKKIKEKQLFEKAKALIKEVEMKLQTWEAKLEQARAKTDQLRKLSSQYTPILKGSIRLTNQAVSRMKMDSYDLKKQVLDAGEAVKQANEILSQPEPMQIKEALHNCV